MPFNPGISPLYLNAGPGADSVGAITKAMEENKSRSRQFKALQTLAKERYGLGPDQTGSQSLEELSGMLKGLELKQEDEDRANRTGIAMDENTRRQLGFDMQVEDRQVADTDRSNQAKMAQDIVGILGLDASKPFEGDMNKAMGRNAPPADPFLPPELLGPQAPAGMDSSSITPKDFVQAYLLAAGRNNVPIRPQDLDQYFRMGQQVAGKEIPDLITRRSESGTPYVWTGGQYVQDRGAISEEPAATVPPEILSGLEVDGVTVGKDGSATVRYKKPDAPGAVKATGSAQAQAAYYKALETFDAAVLKYRRTLNDNDRVEMNAAQTRLKQLARDAGIPSTAATQAQPGEAPAPKAAAAAASTNAAPIARFRFVNGRLVKE